MAYGFNGFIGLAKETGWGSATAATDYVEALNENITVTLDRFDYKNIIGSYAEPDDQAGVLRIAGDMVFAGHPIAIGHFLKGVFQTKSLSTVGSSLWQHTFMTTQADFAADCPNQPYTLEIFRDVTSSQQYDGCLISKLDMSITPNQDVRFSAGIIGRNTRNLTKTSPTFPGSPTKPFIFSDVSLQIAGAATTIVEALTVSVQNQMQGIPILDGTSIIGRIRRTGFQMISISGTMDFQNITEYNNFINQTEQAMIIAMTKASSFQMVYTIPRMVYLTHPLGIPGRQRLTVAFTGKGFYHSGSATAIRVQLTNTKSVY